MRITENNISRLPEKEQGLVKALLRDLDEMNEHLYSDDLEILYLDWIDEHTEYSPERTDPCPDFYGMYRVKQGTETLGVEMTLDDLDMALCLLHNYLVK